MGLASPIGDSDLEVGKVDFSKLASFTLRDGTSNLMLQFGVSVTEFRKELQSREDDVLFAAEVARSELMIDKLLDFGRVRAGHRCEANAPSVRLN